MTNELEQYIKSYFGVVQSDEPKTISSLFKTATVKKGDYNGIAILIPKWHHLEKLMVSF